MLNAFVEKYDPKILAFGATCRPILISAFPLNYHEENLYFELMKCIYSLKIGRHFELCCVHYYQLLASSTAEGEKLI